MEDCIFCKIRDGKIPAKFVFQDEDIMVFPDIHPSAPTHLLIVPKKHIPEVAFLEDETVERKIFAAIRKLVADRDLEKKGYKIMINGGGMQDVDHLHVHLMGELKGRK